MKNKAYLDKLSPEELVQSFVFPHELTKEEKRTLDEEMRVIRFERLKSQTDEQKMYADLIQLRIKMEDAISKLHYEEDKSFGNFLTKYLKITNRNQRNFAKEIDVHFTKLNRILNDKEDPNIQFVYRLEKHSANMIAAKSWWNIHMKKIEYQIEIDEKMQQEEAAKVSNALIFEFKANNPNSYNRSAKAS